MVSVAADLATHQPDTALAAYARARQIDPTLDSPAAWLVNVAADLATKQPDAALATYTRARQIDPTLSAADADTLNTLCWQISLAGHAAEVLDACEQAVAGEPNNGGYRDSRGLARALSGDYMGAIEDFRAFIVWAPEHNLGNLVSQRLSWIATLEAGRNPIDAQTLEQLRGQ